MPLDIKDYIILKKLQKNGRNKVYLVRHKKNPKKYILKIVPRIEGASHHKELLFHQQLNHKYIVQLIDFNISDNKVFMLIEYAEFGDLFGFQLHFSEMRFENQMRMFYKIITSVKYLHQKNLVHRDLKPENILISTNLRPKLADFGTSNLKNKMGKTFCGTKEYMAPEIYKREQQTEKVDIWSLGVLLYEITQNTVPFKEHNIETIEQIISQRLLKFKPGTNTFVIQFIYDTLVIDPIKRPTCDQLLQHSIFNVLDKNSKNQIKDFMKQKTNSNYENSCCEEKQFQESNQNTKVLNILSQTTTGDPPSNKSIKSLYVQKYLDQPKSFDRQINKLKDFQTFKDKTFQAGIVLMLNHVKIKKYRKIIQRILNI